MTARLLLVSGVLIAGIGLGRLWSWASTRDQQTVALPSEFAVEPAPAPTTIAFDAAGLAADLQAAVRAELRRERQGRAPALQAVAAPAPPEPLQPAPDPAKVAEAELQLGRALRVVDHAISAARWTEVQRSEVRLS